MPEIKKHTIQAITETAFRKARDFDFSGFLLKVSTANGSSLWAILAIICRYFSSRVITCKGIAGTDFPSVLEALIVPDFLFIMEKPRGDRPGHIPT
jgi:hypothetical protein